jgi:hypothetical protein
MKHADNLYNIYRLIQQDKNVYKPDIYNAIQEYFDNIRYKENCEWLESNGFHTAGE